MALARKKIVLGIALLAVIAPVTFVVLVYHSVNSLTVASWGITTEYTERGFLTPSKFTVRITIAIGNKGVFDVTMWNAKVKLMINGIYMGTLNFEEEWYIIPHFGWRQFTGTYSVSGSDADSLHSAGTLNAYLNLRGEASCIFYRTIFETSS